LPATEHLCSFWCKTPPTTHALLLLLQLRAALCRIAELERALAESQGQVSFQLHVFRVWALNQLGLPINSS
jgi:hypothetical protein